MSKAERNFYDNHLTEEDEDEESDSARDETYKPDMVAFIAILDFIKTNGLKKGEMPVDPDILL